MDREGGAQVARRSIVYFLLTMVFVNRYAVWSAYADTAPMSPSYPKICEMKASVVPAGPIAVVSALGLSPVTTR
jgi:hypothetical protein